MMRLLFWLALIVLVVAAIRSKLKGAVRPSADQPVTPPRPAPLRDVADAESMLCCAHCGVYYPASETVKVEGRDYCSPAHASLPAP